MEQREPAQQPASQNTGHKVRRPRAARACDLCRVKKNKCDELYPSCTYCRDRNVECVYRGQDVNRRRFMPEYVRHLEDLVRQLSAANADPNAHDTIAYVPQEPTSSQPDSHARAVDNASTVSAGSRQGGGQEVSGVNRHTRNVEFYGRSSSVALLSQVQRSGGEPAIPTDECADIDGATILSNLHNPVFTPPSGADNHQSQEVASSFVATSHYPQCRGFLEGFFSSIHYIHPIVDKTLFLRRCERLWSGHEPSVENSSFTALYYAILSLGALVGIRDDEPIDGVENIRWSRKFFDEARARCRGLGMVTDLEMVQCYFFLAKVCQNELNPHLSYMYTGMAVRTALAMGINREPGPDTKKDPAQLRAESRTWWGIYSFETEISFALGRPDTLGADQYHNRRFPVIAGADSASPDSPVNTEYPGMVDPPYCAIIKPMVDFSKITRKVCLGIYLQDTTPAQTVALANQIEQELDGWIDSLPGPIRPRTKSIGQPETLKNSKEARWSKRQRLVLLIRYLNLRILLFGSLLLTSTPAERAAIPQSAEAVQNCLEAAKQTIQVIYEVYQHHDFFHTWFYNTTYTVFAASIILVYVTQEATEAELAPLLRLVGMAIEILETMDECVVAAKAAQMLHRASERAERKFTVVDPAVAAASSSRGTLNPDPAGSVSMGAVHPDAGEPMLHLNQYWGPLNFVGGEMELDFGFQFADLDGASSLLMGLGDHSELQ